MNGLRLSKVLCFSFVLLTCFPQSSGYACASCNIFNHLGTAVETTDFLGKATVLSVSADQLTVKVAIQETLKGSAPQNNTADYQNDLRLDLSVGDTVLAVRNSSGTPVIYNTLFPLSFQPEFRLLMNETTPQDADEAVRYLTAVSAMLHWKGAPYYKAYPHDVQRRLKDWLQSLHIHPNTPFYEAQQYLFGISAIMRGPPEGAEELAMKIMGEFWQLTETASVGELQWMLTKLTAVFDMASVLNLERLKNEAAKMLESASQVQLLRLAQCLIISGLMTPLEIAAIVPQGPAQLQVSRATLLAAWRHESAWDKGTAKKLAEAARSMSNGQEDPMIASLEKALERGSPFAVIKRPSLAETPQGLGWAIDSILFDTPSWDSLEPYKPVIGGKTEATLLLGFLIFLAALYAWRSRQRCRVQMEPAE